MLNPRRCCRLPAAASVQEGMPWLPPPWNPPLRERSPVLPKDGLPRRIPPYRPFMMVRLRQKESETRRRRTLRQRSPERCLHARKLLPRPDAREKFHPQRRPVLPSEIRREERKKRRRFRHPAFQRMIPSVKLLTNSGTRWRHPLPRPRPGRNGPQAAEMSMCLWHPHRIPVLLFSR